MPDNYYDYCMLIINKNPIFREIAIKYLQSQNVNIQMSVNICKILDKHCE